MKIGHIGGRGWSWRSALALPPLLLVACYSGLHDFDGDQAPTEGEEPGVEDPSGDGVEPPAVDGQQLLPQGTRRLSLVELDNTMVELLKVAPGTVRQRFPVEGLTPFDNDALARVASDEYIGIMFTMSRELAEGLRVDAARRAEVLPCEPSSADDVQCMSEFVSSFVSAAFRRPLSQSEIDAWVELGLRFVAEYDSFDDGVTAVLQATLMSPEFYLLIERGEQIPGTDSLRLDGVSLASQLSYFLLASPPDADTLALAAEGQLETDAQLRVLAERMLQDPRSTQQVQRFHQMWLGYGTLDPQDQLESAMRGESDRLIEHIFGGRAPWTDLFTASYSFIDDRLAEHYGLELPGSTELVEVDTSIIDRRGFLSHASFLSTTGIKEGDTDPTLRGLFVRERLMCAPVPEPPADIDTEEFDNAQGAGQCKEDRYAAHRDQSATCYGCHQFMDEIGFGLENYDAQGRYREHDDGNESCVIDGQGQLPSYGEFEGPAELGDALVSEDVVSQCMVRYLYHFATGRQAPDHDAIEQFHQVFADSEFDLRELMLAIVTDDRFVYRRTTE